MSGGAGHIFSMIASLKNNKRNRKSLFEKDVIELNVHYGTIEDYKKLSSQEFEAFRKKLKENELNRQKRLWMVFGGIMIVIIITLSYFLFFY